MPKIDLRHPHGMDPSAAKQKIEPVLARMNDKFGLEGQWQGDAYVFVRSGVKGRVSIEPTALHVEIELGMLLGALKPMIEKEIREQLSQQLG